MSTTTPNADQRNLAESPQPLRILFVITSMPIGGAETLLVNLIRRLDGDRFAAEVCCLKEPGPLGEVLAREIPVHSRLLRNKLDLRVFPRLRKLIRQRRIDAVLTIGAGDKMFWGRLAAWTCGVPVIAAALHSTGWPDVIGRLNRCLTPITDAFIGVASAHGRYLVDQERFPPRKVRVIPNGVNTMQFQSRRTWRDAARAELGWSSHTPVVGVVAALRPEKNLRLFLKAAARLAALDEECRFLIVGDGPQRSSLQQAACDLGVMEQVRFLGARSDIPQLLNAMDVFSLTSRMEANPVSILEALACGVPVVATNVGSVKETVRPGETGRLVNSDDDVALAAAWSELLRDDQLRQRLGDNGRRLVREHWSLDAMVRGYENLISEIHQSKSGGDLGNRREASLNVTPAEGTVANYADSSPPGGNRLGAGGELPLGAWDAGAVAEQPLQHG